MYRRKYAFWVALVALVTLGAADDHPPTTQQDLVGAWRLIAIEVDGREIDPFYGSGSRGVLIYDKSGWFSVQIEGAGRPQLEVPATRPAPEGSEATARLKSRVLDSYYAYFGTWSFDAATSTVMHHAKGALYPSEDEATYAQHVEITGRQLIFSRTQTIAGHTSVQVKRWERINSG